MRDGPGPKSWRTPVCRLHHGEMIRSHSSSTRAFLLAVDALAFGFEPDLVVVVAVPRIDLPDQRIGAVDLAPFELIEQHHAERRVVVHLHQFDHVLVRHVAHEVLRWLRRHVGALALSGLIVRGRVMRVILGAACYSHARCSSDRDQKENERPHS